MKRIETKTKPCLVTLSFWYLKILKKTALNSWKSFVKQKTSRPKGQRPLVTVAPFPLHSI